MYNEEDYRQWLEEKGVFSTYHKLDKDKLLDDLVSENPFINKAHFTQSQNRLFGRWFQPVLPLKPLSVNWCRFLLFQFGYKRCCECAERKPIADFRDDRSRWDGKHSTCANCAREQDRNRYYRQKA